MPAMQQPQRKCNESIDGLLGLTRELTIAIGGTCFATVRERLIAFILVHHRSPCDSFGHRGMQAWGMIIFSVSTCLWWQSCHQGPVAVAPVQQSQNFWVSCSRKVWTPNEMHHFMSLSFVYALSFIVVSLSAWQRQPCSLVADFRRTTMADDI